MTEAPLAPAPAIRAAGAASVETLSDALENESRLLGELAAILRRQREGVAADDVQKVDDSVFAAHRIMRTIEEARRRRRTLTGILLGAEDVPVQDLELALGARATPVLGAASGSLQFAARSLSREIEINRRVLRGAIEAGDAVVRTLCGAHNRPVSYDAAAQSVQAPAGGGTFFNQQV
ncbi:MAG: flagellar export chaperone FlgN [Longimicrobiales bacterium]